MLANMAFWWCLPIVALGAWWVGTIRRKPRRRQPRISRYYLSGLNYLLNDETDKAIEIFLKKLDVTPDTIETHLSFGNVFRREGEVDRAIRVHQNILQHSQTSDEHRKQALLALAQDYLSAGILDRAEELFLGLIDRDARCMPALEGLLDVYQQEQNWHGAIRIAKQLSRKLFVANIRLAHYYCELANKALKVDHINQAEWYLKKAASADNTCVRVYLMQAECAKRMGDFERAIHCYQQVVKPDCDLSVLALQGMHSCYHNLNQLDEWCHYLEACAVRTAHWSVVLVCVEYLNEAGASLRAIERLEAHLIRQPLLSGVLEWTRLKIRHSEPQQLLIEVITQLNKLNVDSTCYQCSQCGYKGHVLHWMCPSCKAWNSFCIQ